MTDDPSAPRSEPNEPAESRLSDFDAASGASSVPVVGVGASAGGLEPLRAFFQALPDRPGCAFVVVQHLSPDFKSLMGELLSRHTSMEIRVVEDGMLVAADTIYLIPPRHLPTLEGDCLRLRHHQDTRTFGFPIDVFLESLAADRGDRAIGVVLSGSGTDGTRGGCAIKGAGGVVLVQDEGSAQFHGMPRSATDSGIADSILPPEQIATSVLRLLGSENGRVPSVASAPGPAETDSRLEPLLGVLHGQTGLDFRPYKEGTIRRRVWRRMGLVRAASIGSYVDLLSREPAESHALARDLRIGVTRFFRDPEVWQRLLDHTLPGLLRSSREGDTLRFWVAGCSTGEEAYSLAMAVESTLQGIGYSRPVKIFATDIDERSIEKAATGQFSESLASDLPPSYVREFLVHTGDRYHTSPKIRGMITFAVHDLLRDPPFTKIDLVSCRNLLIYLKPEHQKHLLSLLHFALEPSGQLLIAPSESPSSVAEAFEADGDTPGLFRKNPDARVPLVRGRAPSADPSPRSKVAPARGARSASDPEQDLLLREVCPPGALVDQRFDVLRFLGDASRFLRVGEGSFDTNLVRMVVPSMRAALSTALHRAATDRREVTYEGLEVPEEECRLALRVIPLVLDEDDGGRYAVLFCESHASPQLDIRNVSDDAADRIRDLEYEVSQARANLQATVEDLEAANEELQSANEELQASNEELQSTNEELQSVNEELHTVNAEHRDKIDELKALTNDFENLIRCTGIPTLFLDVRNRIRRWNPQIRSLIPLMEHDTGRHVGSFSSHLIDVDLAGVADRVLETGEPSSREVYDRAGNCHMLRANPFVDHDDDVAGVVLTFVDLAELKAVEAARHESDERLRQMAEGISEVFYLVDRDASGARLHYVSPAFEEVWGRPPELLRDDPDAWLEAIHPDDRARVSGAWHQRGQNESFSTEYRIIRPDGEERWVSHSVAPTVASEDGILRSAGRAADITERKRLEIARREIEARLRLAIEAAGVGVWHWDLGTGAITWDYRMHQLFGLPTGAFSGRYEDFLQMLHPDDRGAVDEAIYGASQAGGEFDIDFQVVRSGRQLAPVNARGSAVSDDTGNVQRVVGVCLDVADRAHALERFQTAFESCPTGMILVDDAGRVVIASSQAALDLGYEKHELEGLEVETLVPTHQATQHRELREIFQATPRILNPMDRRPDLEARRKDGTSFPVEIGLSTVQTSTDRFSVVALENVEQKRAAEQRLLALTDELRRSNHDLESFAYAASHDMREPLRMVTSYVQLLEQRCADALDADSRRYIHFAVEGARRMGDMIKSLLAYSRVSRDAPELDDVPLGRAVEGAIENLKARVQETGAAITVEALPSVRGNEVQLIQIFQNLVDNALKYRSDGPPELRISAEVGGEWVDVSIADNGIGFDPDQAPRIFDVFQRLHSSDTYPGTGIGLALVKRMVERHGGRVSAESVPGEGSVFHVTLPAADDSEKEHEDVPVR